MAYGTGKREYMGRGTHTHGLSGEVTYICVFLYKPCYSKSRGKCNKIREQGKRQRMRGTLIPEQNETMKRCR